MRKDMVDTDEKLDTMISDAVKAEKIPECLSPEAMTAKLHEESRRGIKRSGKWEYRAVAVLCACMVLVVSISTAISAKRATPISTEGQYVDNVGSYDKLYQQMRFIYQKSERERKVSHKKSDYWLNNIENGFVLESADYAISAMDEEAPTANGDTPSVSETITQVEGVAEADIVKSDGKAIYYLYQNNLHYLPVDHGKFDAVRTYQQESEMPYVSARDLYLVDGNAVVVYAGTYDMENGSAAETYVAVYAPRESDGTPELIGSFYQDGAVTETRVVDGVLYLVTSSVKYATKDLQPEQYECYVPCCGKEIGSCIPAEDILIDEDFSECLYDVNYTIAASWDVHSVEMIDSKAFTGDNSTLYMTRESMYLATSENDKTSVTRIAYDNGTITPLATANISGTPLGQYAMHETEDAFFIASNGRDQSMGGLCNSLYSFDKNMQQLDYVSFANGEQMKAVNYVDNFAYVVTFYQTDPLFCIDCTDPSALMIQDEYKVSGYSTFLYPWNEHLLSYGVESGEKNGIKLMMYDTDESGQLTMLDDYFWKNLYSSAWYDENPNDVQSYSSPATWDYKSLYFRADQNRIGVPMMVEHVRERKIEHCYIFLTFNESTLEFEECGRVTIENGREAPRMRCIEIGDVLYLLCGEDIVSVDSDTLETIASTQFAK